MKNYEKLVWKLIDREISDSEFAYLQTKLLSCKELREYYQECLETDSTLASRHHSPFLGFQEKKTKKKIVPFFTYGGWAAAVIVLFSVFFSSHPEPSALLVSSEGADWRGIAVHDGDSMPTDMLHLQKGAIEVDFPSKTKVVIEAPAYFQISSGNSLILGQGMLTATHEGKPGSFSVQTPVGSFFDLGTQFGVFVDHTMEEATVITEVFEGNIKFEGFNKNDSRFINEGENAIIKGKNRYKSLKIIANHPYAQLFPRPNLKVKSPSPEEQKGSAEIPFADASKSESQDIDAIDIMLDGNLRAQINYSMVKGIATALDQKVKILENAQSNYTPSDNITFAEAAMSQIEAMGQSIAESYVKFPEIRYWEACQTAEVIWDEQRNAEGQITHRIPHAQRLKQPREGNRLLKNLETIREWITDVHLIHENKGMGWASKFGCPEDGKAIFDKRNKNLLAITYAIDSIKSNLD